jgi:hydroxymethylglutaryl-CoA synthase
MAGITSYGAYVPLYRLSRAEIGKAWDAGPGQGERAVANYDEDSLTMAVEAARDCLGGVDPQTVDGLFFASTTAPYKEKQTAAMVAMVLGIKREAVTVDFGGSLRSGSNALRAAMDAVKSGTAKNVLVVASEMRLGYPAGAQEMSIGDGAAAVLVSDKGVVAEIEGSHAIYEELQDHWRCDRDMYVRSAEDRFITDEGYGAVVPEAVNGAFKKFNQSPKDFNRIVLYVPNQRQVSAVVKKLGFDPKTQSRDSLFSTVGDAGSAMSLLCLVEALEEAKAGERILFASYSNGCDVMTIKVTDAIGKLTPRKGVKGNVASKRPITNYNKYLRWRELVTIQPAPRPSLECRPPGPQALWRENNNVLRLVGTKCKNCGTPQDNLEPYSFLDKKGTLFSFCHDHVMTTIDPPVTVCVVDFESGGRLLIDMTDRDPAECKVGMPIDFTFRRTYYTLGIYNYWWKCRPTR